MPVSGNYSNYNQYGQVGQLKEDYDNNSDQKTSAHAFSYTQINITQDNTAFSQHGLRYERSEEVHQMGMLSFDAVVGADIAGYSEGFHVSPGMGGKASLNIGKALAIYGTAMGTANYTSSQSSSSFGVGYRTAYGAEIKMNDVGFYGELFNASSTNNKAQGYAVGLKSFF